MNKTLKMGFVAAFIVFTLAIMSAQAGGEAPPIKGGIADLRYVKTKMTVNLSASNNTTARNADEGSATTGDTTTGTTSGEVSTAGIDTCDFSGFAQNDVVNNAYAGGASLTGVVKPNIHIGYFDARVLNAYFGANEPNPGIVYSNTGSILVSLQNIAGTNFAFSYTCAVKLTVRTFSSVDGSGTALSTYTLAKNLPGTAGPYNVWTNFSQPINATVRSISISGDAARWGMDQVSVNGSTTINVDFSSFIDGTAVTTQVPGVIFSLVGGPDASGPPTKGYGLLLNATQGFVYPTANILRATFVGIATNISFNFNNLGSSDGDRGKSFYTAFDSSGNVLETGSLNGLSGQLVTLSASGVHTLEFNNNTGGSESWVFGIGSLRAVVTAVNPSPSPTIASVSPTYGSQFGGTAFTLTGTNFTGATSVKIGGVTATNLAVVSATQITAVTPSSLTSGAKDVVVTTPVGSSTALASFTYTAAVPVLALTNNAGSCNRVGALIDVDATLSGVISPIVAGQVYITWNSSKMTLDSITAGDAPFNEFHVINQTAGTALILVSLQQGGSAVSVLSKIVARMHFTVAGGSCDGSGTDIQFFPDGILPTEFTDGVGGKMVPALVASSGFKVDDGAPVLSNVPANVTVQAEAGMGSFANVALTPPTATDACAPGLTASSSRSDGRSLGAAFPVGTTTVTWSATDPCANTTTATTRVTVNNANTATFAVSYTNSGSYAASSARLLTLNIHGDYVYTLKASQPITLVNGAGTISLTDLAVDNYACVAIEEKGRSLRRVATMSDAGLIWSSTATLVAGDLIDDEVIDVLDWGAYIVGNPNADLDGNSVINAVDGNIIITNFGLRGETDCGTSFMGPSEPISAISVAELVERGLTDLIGADLNNDGWLDMEDVRMANN